MALTRRGRGMVIVLLLVIVAGIVVAGGVAVEHRLRGTKAADFPGPGTGRTVVQVHEGDSATVIGQTLVSAGVVASVRAFRDAAEADPRSESIAPGYYALRARMQAAAAVQLLLNPAALLRTRVTIPEGTSLKRVLPLLSTDTQVPLAQLQAAVQSPATLGLPSYAGTSVEGFLFPATYDVPPGTSATQLLQMMTSRFAEAASDVGLVAGAQALKITPLQVVTIASIIERESAGPADAAKVARVFYNRLAAGMPLGSEFTVVYSGNDPNSPYNTYTHHGYPPGPYDSPGEATLTAALHPATGSWLYFVTLPKEGDVFVDTGAQFEALQAKCVAEGGCK